MSWVVAKDAAREAVVAQSFVEEGGRRLHHCFLGGMGADWDEAGVLAVIDAAEDEDVRWAHTLLGTCLVVRLHELDRPSATIYTFDSVRERVL